MNPFKRWEASATTEAIAQTRLLADAMHVSQGSLVDTALRELLKRSPDEIAVLMREHKHLTDEEFGVVAEVIKEIKKPSESASKRTRGNADQ